MCIYMFICMYCLYVSQLLLLIIHRQTDRTSERQTDRQTSRQTDSRTDRYTDSERYRTVWYGTVYKVCIVHYVQYV